MSLSTQEEVTLSRLLQWEEKMFFVGSTNDFLMTYEKWLHSGLERLNGRTKQKLLMGIDQAVFLLNTILHSSKFQKDARESLIQEAQVFSPNVHFIEDMKHLPLYQLQYLSKKKADQHRMLSLVQGGLSGSGGFLLLGIDLPLLLSINLHAIQSIALTYGYDTGIPFEMVTVLKILRVNVLPKRLKSVAWKEIQDEMIEYDPYFYTGRDDIEDEVWLDRMIRQLGKTFLLAQFRKKIVNGFPLLGIAAGAGLNYSFTKNVTELAQNFYQKRYLLEKKGE